MKCLELDCNSCPLGRHHGDDVNAGCWISGDFCELLVVLGLGDADACELDSGDLAEYWRMGHE